MARADKRFPDNITGQLRWYVRQSGLTLAQIGQDTGIDKAGLSRFVHGERGLHLDNIDVLGKYLGLRVVQGP